MQRWWHTVCGPHLVLSTVACRALSNVADEGLLKEGFFWIPSLAGPTTLALQKSVRCDANAICHFHSRLIM